LNNQIKNIKVMKNKVKALAQHLGVSKKDIEQSTYDENLFEFANEEYLVVTDEEADELWEQELDNYLEECVYPELTGDLSRYFDDEAWKRDARYDGRGHSLARYDGHENEETVKDETYYIYRVN
jgi:hypothetical protein